MGLKYIITSFTSIPPRLWATNIMGRSGTYSRPRENRKSFPWEKILFVLVGPDVNLVIFVSYPNVRIRACLQIWGRRSVGQKTDRSPVSAVVGILHADSVRLISRRSLLDEPFKNALRLCLNSSRFDGFDFGTSFPEFADCSLAFSRGCLHRHVLYGWPFRPWTKTILSGRYSAGGSWIASLATYSTIGVTASDSYTTLRPVEGIASGENLSLVDEPSWASMVTRGGDDEMRSKRSWILRMRLGAEVTWDISVFSSSKRDSIGW